MLNSLWTENAPAKTFEALSGDRKTDILIIGGGMAGILCAYFLQQAGADCLLIEADRIGRGVTGNTTAKITSQHGLIYEKLRRQFSAEYARAYWEINQKAIDQYEALAKRFPCDFEKKDNVIYSLRDPSRLEKELGTLRKLGIPAGFLEELPIPVETVGGVVFPEQAQFHPMKFLSQIAKDLPICEQTEARFFEKNKVHTNHGTVTAEKIIMATHFPILNKHGGYFLKMYQQRSYVLALEGAPAVREMYMAAEEDGFSFRGYGDLLLLGGGGHRTGKAGEGWKPLEELAREAYPKSKTVYRWATQDCITLDDVPYIGQYSKAAPNLFVTTGFNKWGMSASMAAAMLLTDLVLGKDNAYERIFSPSRTVLRPRLAANILESTGNLLRPTVPRCPHLGCALRWNPRERSWDCPCHGSRFSEKGELLNNPATGNMKHSQSG